MRFVLFSLSWSVVTLGLDTQHLEPAANNYLIKITWLSNSLMSACNRPWMTLYLGNLDGKSCKRKVNPSGHFLPLNLLSVYHMAKTANGGNNQIMMQCKLGQCCRTFWQVQRDYCGHGISLTCFYNAFRKTRNWIMSSRGSDRQIFYFS